jgi:hypothetical protein
MLRATRREFMRHLGLGAAAFPFLGNLPSLGFENSHGRKRRLVIMFSPNGVVPPTFWPDEPGELTAFKESLEPLAPFRDRTLLLHGVCDKIRGDGSAHQRGIGCLLTGRELLPGNQQGGSGDPTGWGGGISIDQEIKNHLQADPQTRTRFGSLEFGVMVPEVANVWTRLSYADANRPLPPIADPYQMFAKLYGRTKSRRQVASILDDVREDLRRVASRVAVEDRHLLERHAEFVRAMEQDFRAHQDQTPRSVPEIERGVPDDDAPRRSRMQIDLMVHAFAADFNRVATLQYERATGQARLSWLGIDEKHHTLSHEPDKNEEAQKKLTKINRWFCEQLAYLVQRLAETPEPGGPGTLLDNTLVVWTNELGKGNNHTMNNIPFVLVGGGLDYRAGRMVRFPKVPHNRLLLSLAHGFGHDLKTFGDPNYCGDGPLTGLA